MKNLNKYFSIGDSVEILRYSLFTAGIVKKIGIYNGMIEVVQSNGKVEWYLPEELRIILHNKRG